MDFVRASNDWNMCLLLDAEIIRDHRRVRLFDVLGPSEQQLSL